MVVREYAFLAFLLSIMISIINVTGSNCRNLYNCLSFEHSVEVVNSVYDLSCKTKVLFLPGVSHFKNYTCFLNNNKWFDFIKETDLLVVGICAGYHALCESSDEARESEELGYLKVMYQELNQP